MTDELKKADMNISTEDDGNDIESTVDSNIEEQYIEEDDALSVDIPIEDIKDLTEEECDILFVKIEVALDKVEDKMSAIMDLMLEENSDKTSEYDELKEEHKRLKNLDKLVHKQKTSIKKNTKEGGLFGNLPIWAFVLFIICALFTIVPVNPYFPLELYIAFADKVTSSFIRSINGAYFCYFMYLGVFLFIELVLFVILLIRGIKSKERMGTFKSYLVMFIANIIIDIPGLIIFLHAALKA